MTQGLRHWTTDGKLVSSNPSTNLPLLGQITDQLNPDRTEILPVCLSHSRSLSHSLPFLTLSPCPSLSHSLPRSLQSLRSGSEVLEGVSEVQREVWMREKSRMEKSLRQAEVEISRLRAEIRSDTVRDLSTVDADNATLKVIELYVVCTRLILAVRKHEEEITLVDNTYSVTPPTPCRGFMENTCAPRVFAKL